MTSIYVPGPGSTTTTTTNEGGGGGDAPNGLVEGSTGSSASSDGSSSTSDPVIQAPKYGTLVANRVFVGGLSTNTTEGELAEAFGQYGSVRDTKIIFDRGGISKGYGFVTFETEEEARTLYNRLFNKELEPITIRNRRLNVAPAVKKQLTHPEVKYAGIEGGHSISGAPLYLNNPCCHSTNTNNGGSLAKFYGGQQPLQIIPKYFIPAGPSPNPLPPPPPGYSPLDGHQQQQQQPPSNYFNPNSGTPTYCYLTPISTNMNPQFIHGGIDPQGGQGLPQSLGGNLQVIPQGVHNGSGDAEEQPQFIMGWIL